MSKGTLIYYGGFLLPHKSASANRVVSNGKIFNALGYNTVFLGVNHSKQGEDFTRLEGAVNMYEEAQPTTSLQWAKRLVSTSNIEKLIEMHADTKAVILYNMPFITALAFKKVLKKRGIALYYDCTEWTKFTDGSFIKKAFKYADEFFVSRFIHKVCNKVICVSTAMQKVYGKKNTVLIPPLVDINDPVWHQELISHTGFEFCFAGIPDGNKERVDKVVQAFCALDAENASLRVIGITREEFNGLYPQMHISPEKEAFISFMGRLSHKETLQYVRSSDCYVFIRERDKRNNAGFPTKFAESYTCNIGLITTAVSDVPLYADKNSACVILEDSSAEALAGAMQTFIKKEKNSANSLNKEFHYEEYIEKVRNWLE